MMGWAALALSLVALWYSVRVSRGVPDTRQVRCEKCYGENGPPPANRPEPPPPPPKAVWCPNCGRHLNRG